MYQQYKGIQIHVVPDTHQAPRKWWKRLVWKPWQATETRPNPARLEEGQILRMGDIYHVSPKTYDVLRQEMPPL